MNKLEEIGKVEQSEADSVLRYAIDKFDSLLIVGYGKETGALLSTGTNDLDTGDIIVMLEILKSSLISNYSDMLRGNEDE